MNIYNGCRLRIAKNQTCCCEHFEVPGRNVYPLLLLLGNSSHLARVLGNVEKDNQKLAPRANQDILRRNRHFTLFYLRLGVIFHRLDRRYVSLKKSALNFVFHLSSTLFLRWIGWLIRVLPPVLLCNCVFANWNCAISRLSLLDRDYRLLDTKKKQRYCLGSMGDLLSHRKHHRSLAISHHLEQSKSALGISNVLHNAWLFRHFSANLLLLYRES